jgi:hypothetical protein
MLHDELVSTLVEFISAKWDESIVQMLVDHGVTGVKSRPPRIEGHIPDLYARIADNTCIIGEAKTPKDFESDRSQKQIECFLKYADENQCMFFLSVPFMYHVAAFGRIEYLASSSGYKLNGYIVHEIGFRKLRASN